MYSPGLWRIGRCQPCPIWDLQIANYQDVKALKKFWRLQFKGTLFYSKDYRRVTSRNSYTVCFTNPVETFGQILYFIELTFTDDITHYPFGVIEVFDCNAVMNFPHLFNCVNTHNTVTVPVQDIQFKCLYISFNCNSFISKFPSNVITCLS